MPIYLYQHPDTQEVKEIIQSVHDNHVYSEGGVQFNRVFTVPQASIDTEMDIYSSAEFREKTGRKKGTVGDLWDKSAELSQERERRNGKDEIKEKAYSKYSKKRNNRKHPHQVHQELINTDYKHFKIEE